MATRKKAVKRTAKDTAALLTANTIIYGFRGFNFLRSVGEGIIEGAEQGYAKRNAKPAKKRTPAKKRVTKKA
jgi:hypothetical protein